MKFPVKLFEKKVKRNPCKSTYLCFAEILSTCPHISPKTLRKYFNQLVDKDDYAKNEKGQIINYLIGAYLK